MRRQRSAFDLAEDLSKAEVLRCIRESADRLEAAIARVPDAAMVRPGVVGVWSLKDVLAHIAWEWLAGQLEAYLESRDPTPLDCFGHDQAPGERVDMSTDDGRNAWAYTWIKDWPLDEVKGRYRRYRGRIEAVVERVPESEFARPFIAEPFGYVSRLRPARAGENGIPLWQWVRSNTWGHFAEHMGDFETAAS